MDLLLTNEWDLMDDGGGGIALTPSFAYSVAQKTANEIKLFKGEGWYDRSQGVPHFQDILGVNPNWGYIRTLLLGCALGIDGVTDATIDLYVNDKRQLGGNIFILTQEGEINVQYIN